MLKGKKCVVCGDPKSAPTQMCSKCGTNLSDACDFDLEAFRTDPGRVFSVIDWAARRARRFALRAPRR
jgi:predicted amidophosphoribosyltransferase